MSQSFEKNGEGEKKVCLVSLGQGRKPGARIFVRSTSFVSRGCGMRKNFFAKRRMRDESAAQVTSPPLDYGGTCHVVIEEPGGVAASCGERTFCFLGFVRRGFRSGCAHAAGNIGAGGECDSNSNQRRRDAGECDRDHG